MGKLKRSIKNLVRNIVIGTSISKIPYVKNALNNRKKKIEEERSRVFKLYAQECLETIKQQLDKEKIEFWLDYGTLLGAIREKDFIKHDLDIDLGMKYSGNQDKIEKAFKEVGISKHREFTLNGKIVEQTYSYKGLCFDIFYYFSKEEYMWAYGFSYENRTLKKVNYANKSVSSGFDGVRYFVKNRGITKLEFKGKEYPVPENPTGYLEENYGKDYMIPNANWNYIEDQTNKEVLSKDDEILMIEYFN